ncbi:MAG TPA: hypothetical protein RMH85_06405 [Polyangiaceae bacterium LLY-WYZ-15_(1-7)]|nr:hypothetical protein [Polyangiaceae bacterium LLY-WYZ-15_(1-7)]HJL03113.1 hypothetical protein [Polyangiaceae bacterium LLY-WYZ-15_(1-7)]HJL08107.1 hypothetical protein [Polyangiaceae bacterium LLY-WYZ-15_(1-7)]HJL33408.1 hypothetical protein [Polyangiaceae bacterium LLY-WYZ-15_(1-7)]HJL37784.1 hypothetical protein [Polyangiaceae bacterium LLY-WYZ-15_(1-7)]
MRGRVDGPAAGASDEGAGTRGGEGAAAPDEGPTLDDLDGPTLDDLDGPTLDDLDGSTRDDEGESEGPWTLDGIEAEVEADRSGER